MLDRDTARLFSSLGLLSGVGFVQRDDIVVIEAQD